MAEDERRQETVHHLEELIQEEVGRNISTLFAAARGGLWSAATALGTATSPSVGIITGFFVPLGSPPAAETDGPVGVALLAHGLTRVGIACRVATDEPCLKGCAAALDAVGLGGIPIDVASLGTPPTAITRRWKDAGVTHAIAIERCGKSADGTPRNMRGEDISAHTAPLDEIFVGGPWDTIAVGDGGNEIGMGSLPRSVIATNVNNGEVIACVTPAKHLIVAGVSNWGAWGLMAALAVVRPEWRQIFESCLDPAVNEEILRGMVYGGPAVDGVTREQKLTVDGFDLSVHQRKLSAIKAAISANVK